MDTKLKGWKAVRIICVILITVLCFTAINRALASLVRGEETSIHPNIVLADLSTNQYFLEKNMNPALYHASKVAYFGSEEAILSGQHLIWFDFEKPTSYYDDEGEFIKYILSEKWSQLQTPDGYYLYGEVPGSYSAALLPEIKYAFEKEAINNQLSEFRSSLEALNNTEGIYYFIEITVPVISDDEILSQLSQSLVRIYGEGNFRISIPTEENYETIPLEMEQVIHSNVGRQTEQFFKSQLVYYILNINNRVEQSLNADHAFYRLPNGSFPAAFSLAFSESIIYTQRDVFYAVRNAYILDLSIIAACILLVIFMMIILIAGAGRENVMVGGIKKRSESIHFSPIDKPYLDIGLALLICWIVVVVFFCYRTVNEMWSYQLSVPATNIVFAAAMFLVVPPALFWFMNLIKRIKAGRFWKHTLIYAILYSCLYGSLRFLIRKAKALWAGTRLTLRVALISLAVFCILFLIGLISAQSQDGAVIIILILAVTAVVTTLLLLYARRLHSLKQGARKASEGNYDTPIDAGAGELGSIAASINNISAGINTAVEERMKSERLKTELITNVSHDIRTPLTSIITYTDLLDHEGLDCERAPEYLEVLKQKSLRLKTLTEELFEAAKAATGNIDVNITDLNIVALINQVLGELDSVIKSSGLDLRVNLPDKLVARADGRLMQRIMENLLSNVFKYSQPGSRVYLNAQNTDPAFVRIEIKNISAQELNFDPSELTERFKRGDDSRADGGSGLGLSIVQSFVSAQKGTFDIAIDGDLFKATVTMPVSLPDTLHEIKLPEIKD